MDANVARLVVLAVCGVGGGVWCYALWRAVWLLRRGLDDAPTILVPPERIDGPPDAVRKEIGRALSGGALMSFAILDAEREGNDVVFTCEGGGLRGVSGWVRVAPLSPSSCEVSCAADFSRPMRRAAVVALAIILLAGLPAVTVLPWFLLARVVPSPNPAVRGQALQALQMAHALWPPFLVMSVMAARPRRLLEILLRGAVTAQRFARF